MLVCPFLLNCFFIQTIKHVSLVSDAVFPQHVSLLHGVRDVRDNAGLILPRGRTLEKHLHNYDRKCVWYKVYEHLCSHKTTEQKPREATVCLCMLPPSTLNRS